MRRRDQYMMYMFTGRVYREVRDLDLPRYGYYFFEFRDRLDGLRNQILEASEELHRKRI